MRLLRPRSRRSRAGFSLIEMVAASGIFIIVGYVFVVSVDMGAKSRVLVMNSSEENRSVRTASASLVEEIRISNDDQIAVTVLGDGNHEVTLKVPIEVGGLLTWGTELEGPSLDPKVVVEPNEDWSYRYTVQLVGDDKQLVRQILDDKLAIQSEEILVEQLDTEDEPCFQVAKNGDMWVVEVATKNKTKVVTGSGHTPQGRRSEFHVRTRN